MLSDEETKLALEAPIPTREEQIQAIERRALAACPPCSCCEQTRGRGCTDGPCGGCCPCCLNTRKGEPDTEGLYDVFMLLRLFNEMKSERDAAIARAEVAMSRMERAESGVETT